MSSRRTIAGLVLLLAPAVAAAYDFKASNGITWSFDVPPGWHVIDTEEGLAEGIHVRIASSPDATWQNPAPPPGEAIIVLGFYLDQTSEKGKKVIEELKRKKEKGRLATSSFDLSHDVVTVDGSPVHIVIGTNGDVDVSKERKFIISSLKKVTP